MEGRPNEMDRPDPARLRISDDDRHQVAEVLRKAAGEGRIDLDELDERLEATYRAKTYGELVPITSDLPARTTGELPVMPPAAHPAPHRTVPPAVPLASYGSSLSFMGDCTRRGVWQVPVDHTAFAMMGGITLDLREAVFEAREVTINAYAIMAGIDIIVNARTQVIVEGIGIMGAFEQVRDKVPPALDGGSPVIRVKGFALMAGVDVVRKPMPGESRKKPGRPR